MQFAGKAVLELEMKIRERFFIVQVSKLVIEIAILVVSHLNFSIFHPERIPEIRRLLES